MKKGLKIILGMVCVVLICVAAAVLGWWLGKKDRALPTAGDTQQVVVNTQTEGEAAPLPEMTEKPEETASPEATPQPENTKQPEETQAPQITPIPEVTAKPETGSVQALHVEGASLCDESGNPVQLRGLSTHGIAWFPQYVNEALVKEFKENWQADIFRLAMYTYENGGYCTDGDKEALKKLVKNGVEYAVDNDMYVIIDWHVLQDRNPNTYKEEAKIFFEEMSALYKDYPNVIYEICNEPNGGTSWQEVKSYAEEVIEVIRKNDEDNIIIVGTPNWCQYVDQAAADPITDYDNIMYALHYYAATHKEDLRKKMVDAYNAGLPIFVSEYGICDASGNGAIDEGQADAWVEEMDRYGISYVAWNISNKNETSAIFKSSCNKSSGFTWEDLSDSGKWLYTMLTGGSGFTGTVPDVPQAPNPPSQPEGNPPIGGVDVVTSGNVEVTLELKDSWQSDGGYCYNYSVTIKNNSDSDISNWTADITFNENIVFDQGWCGTYTVNGNTLQITPAGFNASISAGQSIADIGFIIKGSSNLQVVE